MREILALEEDARAAERFRQPFRLVQRRGPADIIAQQLHQLGAKLRIATRVQIRAFKFLDRRYQRLRNEASAEGAIVAAPIGVTASERRFDLCHGFRARSAGRISSASNSARNLSWHFTPGEDSTPEERSIPYGRTASIASRTFAGFKPPDSMTGRRAAACAASVQSIVRPVPPRLTGSCASNSTVKDSGTASSEAGSKVAVTGTALITGSI